jgi:putative ABC transport system substrate-binding protein
MKRREFLGMLAGVTSAWPGFAYAQQNQAPKRVGLLANLPLQPLQKFRQKLQALGWVEGKNLIIEYRYGEGRDSGIRNSRLNSYRCRWTFLSSGEALPHLLPSTPPRRFRF